MKYEPQEISSALLVFPASVSHLIPPYDEIPKEFRSFGSSGWVRVAEDWFNGKLTRDTVFLPKEPGLDTDKALRHLAMILRSFEPQHEHKIASVAFLMSEWFEGVE